MTQLLLLAALTQATAGPVTQPTTAIERYGILGAATWANSDFSEASAYGLLPAWVGPGERSLLFVQPYVTRGQGDELTLSLGLGYRQHFDAAQLSPAGKQPLPLFDEGLLLGASLFMDTLRSDSGNNLNQLGLGAELSTHYLSFRWNGYLPLSNKERYGERTYATQVRQSYADGTGEGSSLVRNATATSIYTFGLYEEAMRGWDVEASLLLPGIDRWCEANLITGYRSLSADSDALFTQIEGWYAGLEVRPVPAVAFTATWFEDEQYRQGDWLLGLRLEVPLEREARKRAFQFRRRPTQERIWQPIIRQNSAVQVARSGVLERAAYSYSDDTVLTLSIPEFGFLDQQLLSFRSSFVAEFDPYSGRGIAAHLLPASYARGGALLGLGSPGLLAPLLHDPVVFGAATFLRGNLKAATEQTTFTSSFGGQTITRTYSSNSNRGDEAGYTGTGSTILIGSFATGVNHSIVKAPVTSTGSSTTTTAGDVFNLFDWVNVIAGSFAGGSGSSENLPTVDLDTSAFSSNQTGAPASSGVTNTAADTTPTP